MRFLGTNLRRKQLSYWELNRPEFFPGEVTYSGSSQFGRLFSQLGQGERFSRWRFMVRQSKMLSLSPLSMSSRPSSPPV